MSERGLGNVGVFFPHPLTPSFPDSRAPRRQVPPKTMWSPSCASSFQPPCCSSWPFCCSSCTASAGRPGPRARCSASTCRSTRPRGRRPTSCRACPGASRTSPTPGCPGRAPPSPPPCRPPMKRPRGSLPRPQMRAVRGERLQLGWRSHSKLRCETMCTT